MSHLKFTSTSQGHIHKYENLKRKIYDCKLCFLLNLLNFLYNKVVLDYITLFY